MADKKEDDKPVENSAATSRNNGKGVVGYNESNPKAEDIHSDDPLVAGLANGTRQAEGKEPANAAPVK